MVKVIINLEHLEGYGNIHDISAVYGTVRVRSFDDRLYLLIAHPITSIKWEVWIFDYCIG